MFKTALSYILYGFSARTTIKRKWMTEGFLYYRSKIDVRIFSLHNGGITFPEIVLKLMAMKNRLRW